MTTQTVFECDECGVQTDDLKDWIELENDTHYCEECSKKLIREGGVIEVENELTPLRKDFIESSFFRGREKSLAKQGFILVVFHVLRKALFKLNQIVICENKTCVVTEIEVKESYTYYKLMDCKGFSLGWKYECDLMDCGNQDDCLGR